MATSLGTNTVVVTRVHCIRKIWAATAENVPSDMWAQQRFRSAWTMIRIFTGRMPDSQRCKVSSCGQRRLWPETSPKVYIYIYIFFFFFFFFFCFFLFFVFSCCSSSLPKQTYSNMLKISPSKNENFQIKKIWYFSYLCSKHRLWVLVRTASTRWF